MTLDYETIKSMRDDIIEQLRLSRLVHDKSEMNDEERKLSETALEILANTIKTCDRMLNDCEKQGDEHDNNHGEND